MSVSDYIALCQRYGAYVRDVQGAGGNISVKNLGDITINESAYNDPDILIVKASGTFMKNVQTKEHGAYFRYPDLRDYIVAHQDDELVPSLETDLAVHVAKLTLSEGSRASMEAPMHALIPYSYVVHTHHILTNVFTCADQGYDALQKLIPTGFGRIPACVPGMALAQAFAKNFGNNTPKLTFLQNHGIVVSGETSHEVIDVYDGTADTLSTFLTTHGVALFPTATAVTKRDETSYEITLFPGLTPSFADLTYLTDNYMYPDAVVFGKSLDMVNLRIEGDTVILTGYSESQSQSTLENIASMNYILYAHEKLGRNTKLISGDIVNYIRDMEQEKYRLQQANLASK